MGLISLIIIDVGTITIQVKVLLLFTYVTFFTTSSISIRTSYHCYWVAITLLLNYLNDNYRMP